MKNPFSSSCSRLTDCFPDLKNGLSFFSSFGFWINLASSLGGSGNLGINYLFSSTGGLTAYCAFSNFWISSSSLITLTMSESTDFLCFGTYSIFLSRIAFCSSYSGYTDCSTCLMLFSFKYCSSLKMLRHSSTFIS